MAIELSGIVADCSGNCGLSCSRSHLPCICLFLRPSVTSLHLTIQSSAGQYTQMGRVVFGTRRVIGAIHFH